MINMRKRPHWCNKKWRT